MPVFATQIENWAQRQDAPFEFPRLLRLLIRATCPHVRSLDMPAGTKVYLGGWDGIVDCSGNEFVPEGLSMWEVSTRADVEAKASSDYGSRTEETEASVREGRAFIAASPRAWSSRRDWEDEKNAQAEWREVRAVCSQRLEEWLEQVPWLARLVGIQTPGLEGIDDVWKEYQAVPGSHELTSGLLLDGREQSRDLVVDWLVARSGGVNWLRSGAGRATAESPGVQTVPSILRLCGASALELRHFVAAVVWGMSEEERETALARVLVLSAEADVWLARLTPQHIVVVTAGCAAIAGRLQRRHGCRILLLDTDRSSTGAEPLPGADVASLENRPASVIMPYIQKIGYTRAQAAELCAQCRCDYRRLRYAVFRC